MTTRITATITLALIALTAACAGVGTVRRGYTTTSTGTTTFKADSIDYRSNLTRIYGKLKGIPHTAGRIDSMTVTVQGRTPAAWTDVDGIDMKRWWQWEDEDEIAVEIDFPPMTPTDSIVIDVKGPRGDSRWIVKTRQAKKQRKAKR